MNDIVVDLEELENEVLEPVAEPVEEEVAEASAPKGRFDDWDREIAVKNYQELEKLNSRQAQELGALRQQAQAIPQPVQQPEKIDVDSLLDDPYEAVSKSISQNPEVQELRQTLQSMKQSQTMNELRAAHPDFMDIIQTPEYQNWIVESPMRSEMHMRANNYDLDAANELLTTFKERQQFAKTAQVKEEVAGKRREDLRAAASEGASSGSTSSKIYRRHDLIRLNQTDPEKYDAMLPEIMKAHAEGRVK